MSKNCLMSGKQCRPWWDVASHLGLHCLVRSVCLNTYRKYGTEATWHVSPCESFCVFSQKNERKGAEELVKQRKEMGIRGKANHSADTEEILTCPLPSSAASIAGLYHPLFHLWYSLTAPHYQQQLCHMFFLCRKQKTYLGTTGEPLLSSHPGEWPSLAA